MRVNLVWTDQVPERNDAKSHVWSVDVRNDGQELIAAVADRVLVYSATADTLLHSLRGHAGGNVYAVAYSKDGENFASGGRSKSGEGSVSCFEFARCR